MAARLPWEELPSHCKCENSAASPLSRHGREWQRGQKKHASARNDAARAQTTPGHLHAIALKISVFMQDVHLKSS